MLFACFIGFKVKLCILTCNMFSRQFSHTWNMEHFCQTWWHLAFELSAKWSFSRIAKILDKLPLGIQMFVLSFFKYLLMFSIWDWNNTKLFLWTVESSPSFNNGSVTPWATSLVFVRISDRWGRRKYSPAYSLLGAEKSAKYKNWSRDSS